MRKSLAVLAAASLAGGTAAVAQAATRTIKVGDNYFVRTSGKPRVTVTKGTTVVWKNAGRAPHNVVVTKGPRKFRSSILARGKSFRKRMTRAGTYTIVCTIHGARDQSMVLRVR